MIVDARSLPEGELIETDVCVVGAGTAGVALVREFIGAGFRVCLLESGGMDPDRLTQSLSWGENIGHPYYPLDRTCIRCFGGTSHRWEVEMGDDRLGVRLRPLDEIDFEQRDWVPYSGWPFDKAHLDPFYQRAHDICQLGPYDYDAQAWQDPVSSPRLPFTNDRVATTIFQFGPRDPFVDAYRDEIAQAPNITTLLYANVVDIETDDTAQTVTRLRVACLQGNAFTVSARLFILATGGVQTPRLLLLSNQTHSTGLGNQHDLVGRFFMEHPHLWSGFYVPSDPAILNAATLYKIHTRDTTTIMGKLTLDAEVLRREKLLSYCVSLHPSVRPTRLRYPKIESDGIESFKAFRTALRRRQLPPNVGQQIVNVITNVDDVGVAAYRSVRLKLERAFHRFSAPRIELFRLNHMAEQAPNPDSRVTLASEKDALGQNRAQLDWQLSPLDVHTLYRAQEIISEELQRAGLGYIHTERDREASPRDIHGGWHNMGTTRMHTDPKQGVVDQHCRVHGVSNLYIAGPSVFPTGGYANPVLTFIALTLRLADHVKGIMA